MRIVIRADADAAIGSGHVMRCLAVAETLMEQGIAVAFAATRMADALAARIAGAGADLVRLDGPCGGAADLAATLTLAAGAATLVVDGYDFPEDYRRALRAGFSGRIVAFDDTAELPALWADVVVNAAPAAAALGYDRLAPGAQHLLGPGYAPLRREIRQAAALPPLPFAERDRILLTFGGSDPAGLTGPTLAALLELLPGDTVIDVAVGGANPRLEGVAALAAALGPRAVLHRDARDMGALMRRAGLAVSAGGGTIGELAALATPTVLAVVAHNQAPAAASVPPGIVALEARGDAASAARIIAATANELWRDAARRQAMSAALSGILDGQGAVRIAAACLPSAA